MNKYLILMGVGLILTHSMLARSETATLTVQGQLVSSTCDFQFEDSTGTPINVLILPEVSESEIVLLSEGEPAPAAFVNDLNLDFSACVNATSVGISFTQSPQTGSAEGVELGIYDQEVLQDGSSISDLDLNGAINGVKPLTANYRRTASAGGPITEGTISKVFNFVITYQ